ncbi:MAG: esterase [Bacteroidales bacterium]|nr:esterase [Bacteroidales bacterium]
MKKLITFIFAFFLCYSVFAQQSLSSRATVKSPEINPDNTVTFRLIAPKAMKVELIGDIFNDPDNGGQGSAQLKEIEGVWTYTTPTPLEPELYFYNFKVDGLKINDPNNVHIIRDVANIFNVFIIGGPRADLYKVNDVPHGTVSRVWYDSPTVGFDRRLTIYTPAGYEQNTKTKYPVFYLMHGAGGDEEAWIALGRTSQILDNLIAQGKAKPMIVVMTNENINQEAAAGESSFGYVQPSMGASSQTKTVPTGIDFIKAFPDIQKFVESNYRTINKKSSRAIGGLSMGGFYTVNVSKENPDTFDYMGVFSAGLRMNDQSKDKDEAQLAIQFSKKPKLYWIGIGKTDFLYSYTKTMRDYFDEQNYPYVYYESEGGHIWRNWRIYLSEFVPLLFK